MIYTSLQQINQFILKHSIPNNIAILHSIAHIESNAIDAYTTIHDLSNNLSFKSDIQSIIQDETNHFNLLQAQLNQYSFKYGDLPVHDNLQRKIVGDLIERLAITSIVSEGRALDRGDNLIQKLDNEDDTKLLKHILKDEIKHVQIGLKWFNQFCKDPQSQFLNIMKSHKIKCNWKVNNQKRKKAGFDDNWLKALEEWKHI